MHKNLEKVLQKSNCTCVNNLPWWAADGFDSRCPQHGIEVMYETNPMVETIVNTLAKEK